MLNTGSIQAAIKKHKCKINSGILLLWFHFSKNHLKIPNFIVSIPIFLKKERLTYSLSSFILSTLHTLHIDWVNNRVILKEKREESEIHR